MTNDKSPELFLTADACEAFNSNVEPLEALESWIDECDMNGDLKCALKSTLKVTATAGRTVVRIGVWFVTTVKRVVEEFPLTSMGALIGFLLGTLISAVPLVGMLLGSLLTPFIVTAATLVGFAGDVYVQTVKAKLLSRVPAGVPVNS